MESKQNKPLTVSQEGESFQLLESGQALPLHRVTLTDALCLDAAPRQVRQASSSCRALNVANLFGTGKTPCFQPGGEPAASSEVAWTHSRWKQLRGQA